MSDTEDTGIDRVSLFLGVWIGIAIGWTLEVVLPGAAGSGVFP